MAAYLKSYALKESSELGYLLATQRVRSLPFHLYVDDAKGHITGLSFLATPGT